MGSPLLRLHPAKLEGGDAWNGRLLVYEAPQDGYNYAIGVDVAEGVGADRSVCSVIRLGTLEADDVQVAEWACDCRTTKELGQVAETLGHFYQGRDGLPAMLVIEVTGPGLDVLSDLAGLSYNNLYERRVYDKRDGTTTNKLGWSTNRTSRPRMLQRVLHALQQGDLTLNSPYLLDEMQDFTTDSTLAKARAKSGRHDDRVMAVMLAYCGGHDEEWLSGDDVAAERRLKRKRMKPVLTSSGKAVKKDYQNTAISYDDMKASWND